MKHISSFNGSVTLLLSEMGYDSSKVLQACNAWLGQIEADKAKTKVTGKVTLTGKVNKDGKDKRQIGISETEKRGAKVGYTAQGALVALSEALSQLAEKHNAMIKLVEFPPEIATWVTRDTFLPDKEVKEEKTPEPAKV